MPQSLSIPNYSAAQLPKIMMVLAGGCFAVGGSSLWWMNSLVMQAQKIADAKTAEVASSSQVARQYETTITTYNDTAAKLGQLEVSGSPNDFVPTFIKQMQIWGQTSQVTIGSIRPTLAPPPPPPPKDAAKPADAKKALPPAYDTITVALDVNGTYPHIVKFLRSMTAFPKIVSVTGVQLHGASGVTTPGHEHDITANFQLSTYVFPQAVADATAPVDGKPLGAVSLASPIAPAPGLAAVAPLVTVVRTPAAADVAVVHPASVAHPLPSHLQAQPRSSSAISNSEQQIIEKLRSGSRLSTATSIAAKPNTKAHTPATYIP